MLSGVSALALAEVAWPAWLNNIVVFLQVLLGFSIIIFFHELGHFLAAKWAGVRVDRFAVGFGPRLFGWRRGEGFTFGARPDYRAAELLERNYGETDYCFRLLPIGGYVKMLGQDDVVINEQTNEIRLSDDPRAFPNRSVSQRMVVVSAGVIFNLALAAVLLTAVFLIGRNMAAAVVGAVEPGQPAEGKLLPGDEIIEINGDRVDSFMDVQLATIFEDPPLKMRVRRNGQVLDSLIPITPEMDERTETPLIGIIPQMTTERTRDAIRFGEQDVPREGDRITHVEGRPVSSAIEIFPLFRGSAGRPLRMTVARPGPDGQAQTLEVYERATLAVVPAGVTKTAVEFMDGAHVLGMLRRRAVAAVVPGGAAEQAGFKPGDVIVQWGDAAHPTYAELLDRIHATPPAATHVLVLRGDQEVALTVTPRQGWQLFARSDPKVGLDFSRGEEDRPVVAQVVADTPAARLNIPRGALLTAIDGQPVSTWFDVTQALMAAAGREVEIRYRSAAAQAVEKLAVPGSLFNELNLPIAAVIESINGQSAVTVDGAERSVQSAVGLRALLASHVGQTVEVAWRPTRLDPVQRSQFTVRADALDAWQLRISYEIDPLSFKVLEKRVDAGGNPFVALSMGVKSVVQFVEQMVIFLSSVVTRRVSTQNVAGPVGIIDIAMRQARSGWSDLLFFMAFLSVNLAVINFLPVPVLDGGMMLFLIIEKIKGKPLSFTAQMVSTLVGLAAIVLAALYVTIQDIGRLFSS